MSLILLAIFLTVTLCVIAYNFAIYALPFMVGLTAFQYAHGVGAGFLLSALAATAAALLSVALVMAVVGFAKNPALRLAALAVFSVPAAIAGYALVHDVMKNATDSAIMLNLLSGAGGLFIGVAAMRNLNALASTGFSR